MPSLIERYGTCLFSDEPDLTIDAVVALSFGLGIETIAMTSERGGQSRLRIWNRLQEAASVCESALKRDPAINFANALFNLRKY